MRYLLILRTLNSNYCKKFVLFHVFKLKSFHFSSLSKKSKLLNSKKTKATSAKTPTETQNFGKLLDEIVGILGTQNLFADTNSSGSRLSEETGLTNALLKEESSYCIHDVRENAVKRIEQGKGNLSGWSDACGVDVSPIVHKVTEIVRAEENSVVPMEERLENAGYEFTLEVVDKVLKRCFKVPHLALRFFNWVKVRNGFCYTTATYNTMIYIAGEAQEFGLVDKLVEEMEKSSCQKDVKTCTILISHYGKAKLIGKAFLIFEKMKKSGIEPDAAAYKQMLNSLCNAGKADVAMEFYKEMLQKDIGLDMRSYKLLLKCLALSGDIDGVHLVYDRMIQVSGIPEGDVYSCVLRSLCISGRITEALELIRDMKNRNINLKPENFEILVKGLCRANRISDALEIVNILQRINAIDGKIFEAIINGYLRNDNISRAYDLYQNMKESGYLPTTSTYTELMQHFIRLGNFDTASELYDEMLKKGVQLDAVALTAMVAGYVRQNRLSESWKMFRSMEERGNRPTKKAYLIFIKELAKVSKTDDMMYVLDEMKSFKGMIEDDIFHFIVSYLEKKGEFDKLKKVKEMQRACKCYPQGEASARCALTGMGPIEESKSDQIEHWSPNSPLLEATSGPFSEQDLQEIIQILSSSEDWCLIQEKLENCTVRFTPDLVLNILSNCALHSGAALCLFSWVEKQYGYSHTSETYNMAIKLSGRAKDFKHMRSLFFEMRQKGDLISPDTWTIMLMQYGRAGLTEIALRTFREMVGGGFKPTSCTYKSLIIALCGRKGRKVDDAIQTFQEMIKVGFIPDKELIETYLDCLCEVGRIVDARKCTEVIHKVGFKNPLCYSLYIRSLCRAGRLEEALATLDEVGPERHILDQYVYGSLVHVLLQKGRSEEALAKVESMKLVGIHPTVHVYTSLIAHFLKEKQTDEALKILEKMKEEGCEPTVVTYSALIHGYMSMGKITEAWDVFRDTKENGPFPDFKTYSMFITSLCKEGRSEEAVQLLSEMLDGGIVPSTVNFRTVIYGLNREGKQNLAWVVLQKKLEVTSRRKYLI